MATDDAQLPHGTYDSSGEGTRFVSRVRTHSGGSSKCCAEHQELETTNREDDMDPARTFRVHGPWAGQRKLR